MPNTNDGHTLIERGTLDYIGLIEGTGKASLGMDYLRHYERPISPNCAIAIPRSASASGSSRSATRFSAASGSPAASARAAAVINESIEIPSHLSLSPGCRPALHPVRDNRSGTGK
jgi:hypothetical protein